MPCICYGYALGETGTWYWRVRARNACGDGQWSAVRTVNVVDELGQVTLSSPSDEDTVVIGVLVRFSWNAVSGANLYRIQWSWYEDFSAVVQLTTPNTYRYYGPNGIGTLYWRVRAENGNCSGLWSSVRTLIVIPRIAEIEGPGDLVGADDGEPRGTSNPHGTALPGLVISVDNGNAVLKWLPFGVSGTVYSVYGSPLPFAAGVLLHSTTNTTWTDEETANRPSPYFYYVTAQ